MRHVLPLVMLFACPQLLAQFSPVVNLNSGAGSVSIQAAIDSAAHGDTLTLAPVSFVESLKVDRPITLLGNPSGGTILDIRDIGGYGIQLDADNISIEDLVILSNPQHTEYAIHSEPGMSGLTLRNIRVMDNGRSGIDLNGLEGDELNLIEGCTVVHCGVGFGLALSSCQNVRVTDFLSSQNLFGDIGILESAYTDNRTENIQFTGALKLLGRNGDGNGAVIVQSDSTFLSSGVETEFDIDMRSGYVHRLSSQSVTYDGAPLGYILCSPDNVVEVTHQLSAGLGISDLVGRNISTGVREVWPGMTLSDALVNAEHGDLIQVHPGDYDTETVIIDKSVTILGPNAGIPGESLDRGEEALFLGGVSIASSGVTIDGIRIQTDASNHDGLTLQLGHDDVVVRNTVIRGSVDTMDDAGQVGVRCMGDLVLEDCSLRNWPQAVDFSSGSLLIERGVVADNQAGVRMDSDNGATDRVEVKNATFINAGADAFSIAEGDANDSLVVTGVSGELHRFVFRFDAEVPYRIEGNQFFNSETQIFGLDKTQRIGLCEANDFSLPPMVIIGCTDADAVNYEACATVDDGSCLQGGCTEAGACNFDPLADYDDGSCDVQSCAGCLNPVACNYNPAATIEGECDFESCRGCTDPAALNYDATATLDDGSCRIAGCLDPEADNYNPEATFDNGVCFYIGCTDVAACNYDPGANLDGGGCETTSCAGCTDGRACNYDATATADDGSCEFFSCRGCTDADASNYDPDATLDDGSCNGDSGSGPGDGDCESTNCEGCTDEVACNYDAEAIIHDGTCDYTLCAGCTDPAACNYDSAALIHFGCTYPVDAFGTDHVDCDGNCINDTDGNGTCDEAEVSGCTNLAACNYSSKATQDDGSCDFSSCYGCTDASACNYDPTVTELDNSCDYTSCRGCMESEACNYLPDATLPSGCIYPGSPEYGCDGECTADADGDGICDGLEILGCTDFASCNFEEAATEDDGSCEYTTCAGCTNPGACNPDPGATINDGSCDYASCVGCTDPASCNYDAEATMEDGSCIYPLDLYNDPTRGCNNECLSDQDGDGICDIDEPRGCMDPDACNYDEDAEFSNGSCEYESCQGCTDPEACNTNEVAIIDDGSCAYSEEFNGSALYDCYGQCLEDADGDGVCDALEEAGCTDSSACNYEPSATQDDGGCTYPETHYDCFGNCLEDTDGDGVCDPLEVFGCTDVTACNYDVANTEEDGSCTYPDFDYVDCDGNCLEDADGDGVCDINEFCVGDFNGDGLRTASDILEILAAYGCLENCGDRDLTDDGIVTAADVLEMLAVFGTACP